MGVEHDPLWGSHNKMDSWYIQMYDTICCVVVVVYYTKSWIYIFNRPEISTCWQKDRLDISDHWVYSRGEDLQRIYNFNGLVVGVWGCMRCFCCWRCGDYYFLCFPFCLFSMYSFFIFTLFFSICTFFFGFTPFFVLELLLFWMELLLFLMDLLLF